MNNQRIIEKYQELQRHLLAEMSPQGYWTGQLSTSALSTAVAIVALKMANDPADQSGVSAGFHWLCQNINEDGGYGDTTDSVSNVSTTLLCYAAISYCQANNNGTPFLLKMEEWLNSKGISFDSNTIIRSILKFYGKDYTFSIPILSMLTICQVLPSFAVNKIPGLPFELTLLPASWYRFFNLRVVSYALPALIAVGIYLHKHRKISLIRTGIIRDLFIKPALRKLDQLVPQSGGFLEAIPLTGFVAMCLIASKQSHNETVIKGLQFLRKQQRKNGGWPIDTDLSTWVTTLSVKALGPHLNKVLNDNQVNQLRHHLLQLQYTTIHPFNNAQPGGWGWTNYAGSVPDADDTPGAILALLEMYTGSEEEINAIENGCTWLIDLQNADGGFPTFCRGWGKLPFDKSCADLTGHALLALLKTIEVVQRHLSVNIQIKIKHSTSKAIDYLNKHQSDYGAWIPLWFGNQQTDDQSNPAYGTAKVSIYLGDCLSFLQPDSYPYARIANMLSNSKSYLISQQNEDGSWGGKINISGTIEETSLAVSALVQDHKEIAEKGIDWLMKQDKLVAVPIGLYFALLWYDEKLYPLIYYTEALRRYISATAIN